MGTKLEPGKFDCYSNALPDEPMFILLARDPFAPLLIRAWANNRRNAILRGNQPLKDSAMVDEALQCAEAMEVWRTKFDGKWRSK